jgi:hypothetical protein
MYCEKGNRELNACQVKKSKSINVSSMGPRISMIRWLVGAFMNCKLCVLVKALRYEVTVQDNTDDAE